MHDAHKPRGTYFLKDAVPPPPGKDTGYPAIVVNRFGSGTSVYFAGQPDRLFQRHGHPDYEEMLVRCVEWISGDPVLRVEAPNTVEATYWQLNDGSYLAHLLNHTHDAIFPAPATGEKVFASREIIRAIRHVVPVHDVRIRVIPRPRSAECLVGNTSLAIQNDGITLTLEEYAVIRIVP